MSQNLKDGMVLTLERCQDGMVLALEICIDGMVYFLERRQDGMISVPSRDVMLFKLFGSARLKGGV